MIQIQTFYKNQTAKYDSDSAYSDVIVRIRHINMQKLLISNIKDDQDYNKPYQEEDSTDRLALHFW